MHLLSYCLRRESTALRYIADGNALLIGHETKKREDDEAGEEGRAGIYAAHHHRLSFGKIML